MVISIWPSRPTMRERAPLTGRTEFPAFERLETTSKKCRMRITGQVRGDSQGLYSIPAPSARTWIPPAASYFPTTKPFFMQEPAHENVETRFVSRAADTFARKEKDNAETRTSQRLAENLFFTQNLVSAEKSADLVLVLGVYSFRSAGARF